MNVVFSPDFESWRPIARSLLLQNEPPAGINWIESTDVQDISSSLFEWSSPRREDRPHPNIQIPPEFLELARLVSCHRDARRWSLIYRLLWRLRNENRQLIALASDDDVNQANRMAKQVSRDIHKMHAFVRFRKMTDGKYFAWHVPDHLIVRLATPFFARRFPGMTWKILTPDASALWDGSELTFGPGGTADDAERQPDSLEDLWTAYYGAVFNPARIKIKAMKKEMPVRYWQNLPETKIIARLLREAPDRVQEMYAIQPTSAAAFVPPGADLKALRDASRDCKGCSLCRHATQTVFGEGQQNSRIVIVGEQPGEQEDLAGRPFVGPAGQLLDNALQDAGIIRSGIYLTNAVKHFKFESKGKFRLHKRPSADEVAACSWWLKAELSSIQPKVIICLGLTAAQTVLGRTIRLSEERGKVISFIHGQRIIITIHPSAILRTPDKQLREEKYRQLVEDFRLAQQEFIC